MDCRQFRKQHSYFIDDMLSGVATWAMREHLHTCASCSRFDTQLRRSLLIARQAPTLEPSMGFQRKLSARLAAEKLARPAFREMTLSPQPRRIPFMAVAAAVLAVTVAGIGFYGAPMGEPVAVALEIEAPAVMKAETVVRESPQVLPAPDQPVHPAMLLAQRATEQFAASQARAASGRPTH